MIMKKAKLSGGRAALIGVVAAFASFAASVWAQEGGAIPAAVETERGGKATLVPPGDVAALAEALDKI